MLSEVEDIWQRDFEQLVFDELNVITFTVMEDGEWLIWNCSVRIYTCDDPCFLTSELLPGVRTGLEHVTTNQHPHSPVIKHAFLDFNLHFYIRSSHPPTWDPWVHPPPFARPSLARLIPCLRLLVRDSEARNGNIRPRKVF